MQFLLRGVVLTAFIGYAGLPAAPVLAAPVGAAVHRATFAPVALPVLGRSSGGTAQFGRVFTLHTLVDAKHRVNGFMGLLPRLGLAAVIAPFYTRRCMPARPAAPIAVLPLTPFAGSDCFDDAFAQTHALPPTSLIAAHDRNALYAPTYTSKDDLH